MKRTGKLLSAALSMVMAVSVIGGLNASAASSFQITDKNFKPVFDFDTTPGTYQNGDTKVGTHTDTVGDSKSEKCIDAQGVGLTYNLAIDSSNAVRGNALKLSVTDQAPEGGAYCPISFNVRYGQNKLVDVYGATDFMFWCDTTGFKDGYTDQKGIILYIQEANVLADGSVTSDASTAWKPKSGTKGGYYLYEDGNGGWAKQANNETDFYLPVNYRGWIKMPMSEFDYCDWNGDTVNDRFYGKQMQVVQFGMGNYKRQAGSVIWFDEMGFTGDFSAASDNNNKPSGGTTSHVQSSAVSSTASDTQNQVSSDTPSDTSVIDSSSESTDVSSVSSDKETKTEKSGSLLWLWIVLGVVAVAGAGAGCWYFLYFKKKHNTEE